ncbi:MAG TPA: precorrin-6y C5,15-methyltransferase (decarboxylating) subunit CbiE, partial [Acidimicrobiales bacterium]|nr:precorrin-6y C5,15-methyltransferase (decarboxylating) subunit CbiE [Acidimicrobiales bacterium]
MADGSPIAVVGLLGGRPVGDAALTALRSAALVAGGRDQLAAVADLLAPGARTVVVGAGMGALAEVAASPGPAVVLASGDPGFFGIVRALASRVGPERLVVHPAPSSVALAFARLGLPWDHAVVRSCHTGDAARVATEVAGADVAAVLTGPDAPPEAVGAALVALGAHHRLVVVATRLGETGEQLVRCTDLADLAAGHFDHRSVVVLAHPAASRVPAASLGGRPHGGRSVADFAHRASMITKPEVRSVVLGKLALPDRGVLWDVGAGSGSVAVEAAVAAPGLRVIAVERNPDDAERVIANAAALGALVEVVEGSAPAVLAGLPRPDRVFVGGGGLDVLDACVAALNPGGRMVATFAAVDRALAAHRLLGNLVQVGVDRADTLADGGVRFAAGNPVFVAWGDRSPTGAAGTGASAGAAADVSASAAEVARGDGRAASDVSASAAEVARGDRRAAPDVSASAAGGSSAAGRVVVGIGCSSGATAGEVAAVVADALEAAGPLAAGVTVEFATVDLRADHPAVQAATSTGARLLRFPASLLGVAEVPNPSAVVADAVGTPSVAEAACLLGAGPGARLMVAKRKRPNATAAAAMGAAIRPGSVHIVGLGPGAAVHRTPAATAAVRGADAVVGYGPYVDACAALLRPEQLVLRGTMGAESDRALAALALARAGWRVALVSSGDPGVFAMAARTLELAGDTPDVEIEVVPGVTAAHAAAAAARAPLG